MTKEYRRELRAIDAQLRNVEKEQRKSKKVADRAITRIEKAAASDIREIRKESAKLHKGLLKTADALNKRRAILAGRLS